MEFPFDGHRTHRHHQRNEEEEYPPPPSYYRGDEAPPPGVTHMHHTSHMPPPNSYSPPPPPGVTHVHHTSHFSPPNSYPPPPLGDSDYRAFSRPPPPDNFNYPAFPSPPPPANVHHVSHEDVQFQPDIPIPNESEIQQHQHYFSSHLPSFLHHNTQTNYVGSSDLSNKPSFRVFCKAQNGFSLTIRDGKVILAQSNQSDHLQHWYKDEKYSTQVKDEEGFPCFALVNKATGLAMKHSVGATHPVQLIPYNPDVLDESILWTLSKDLGDGYRTIRMVNNIRLNVDAFHGDKNHGGVHDGTTIVLYEWKKGDNQRWKIMPY